MTASVNAENCARPPRVLLKVAVNVFCSSERTSGENNRNCVCARMCSPEWHHGGMPCLGPDMNVFA